MSLTASALANEIQAKLEEQGVTLPLRNIKDTLKGLGQVAEAEITAGHDFTIPSVVKLVYTYRPASKKGERWKKGETVVGFGGMESVKEEDSPATKAKIKLVARPTGAVARIKPGSKPEAQAAFLKSKAGKQVVKNKSRA